MRLAGVLESLERQSSSQAEYPEGEVKVKHADGESRHDLGGVTFGIGKLTEHIGIYDWH